jgi:hypothetical protein
MESCRSNWNLDIISAVISHALFVFKSSIKFLQYKIKSLYNWRRDHRGRERMVVAISAYHHWCCEFASRSGRGVQHYVIKFLSDLRQVDCFLRVLRFPTPPNKINHNDIAEILLKVALSTIKQTNQTIDDNW